MGRGLSKINPRSSWINVIQHESELEFELDRYVLSLPAIATNTNELMYQSIFNYTKSRAELREFDSCGFDLRTVLAVTTLLTAIAIKQIAIR